MQASAAASLTTTVPFRIHAGPTCYLHCRLGHKDYYAPDFAIARHLNEFTWRYGVSPKYDGTIFFFNERSGRSVWLLPVVDPYTLREREMTPDEVMRVEEAPSAVTTRAVSSPRDVARTAEPSLDPEADIRQLTTHTEAATPLAGNSDADRVFVGSSPSLTASSPAPHHSPEKSAISPARKAPEEHRPASISKNVASTTESRHPSLSTAGTASSSRSVEERLTAWRAKRRLAKCLTPSEDAGVSLCEEEDTKHIPAASADYRERPLAVPPISICSTSPPASQTGDSRSDPQSSTHLVSASAPERTTRTASADDLQTQRECKAPVDDDRFLLEQRRWTQEVEALEEAELLRLATAQRVAEERRLKLSEEDLVRLEANRQRDSIKEVEAAAAEALHRFTQEEARAIQASAAAKERALNFGETLAARLREASETMARKYEDSAWWLQSHRRSSPVVKDRTAKLTHSRCTSSRKRVVPPARPTSADKRRAAVHPPSTWNSRRTGRDPRRVGPGQVKYRTDLEYRGDLTTSAAVPWKSSGVPIRKDHGTQCHTLANCSFSTVHRLKGQKSRTSVTSLQDVLVGDTWPKDAPSQSAWERTTRTMKVVTGPRQEVARVVTHRAHASSIYIGGTPALETDRATESPGNGCGAPLKSSGGQPLTNRDDVTLVASPTGKEGPGWGASPALRTVSGAARPANEDRHGGNVVALQPHAHGAYPVAEGHPDTGCWNRGARHGTGTSRLASGDVYVGSFHEGLFHGLGCYVHKDKYIYEGQWEAGRMHGRGRLTFVNGDVWEGTFRDDRRVEGSYTCMHVPSL